MKVSSELAADYYANPKKLDSQDNDQIISAAIRILEDRMRSTGELLSSPEKSREFLYLQLAQEVSEVFCVLFLDNRHRVIEFRRMFNGTIDGASVHPREVVRACIEVNAAAVILAHNHPSGIPDPSQADIKITQRLVDALALIDIRTLDHIVIGENCNESVSFAERGLI